MEHFGWWSILPPLLTIVLALVTKDVVLSLFLGIFSGAMIATGGGLFASLMLFCDTLIESLGDSWNLRIFLFCALLGALVGLMSRAGAAQSFGAWMSRRVKGPVGALCCTAIFGILVFIDDYFNSLAVGTSVRPLCDRMKIPRAKLAYILDSTAAPVCILAPISTWVAIVMSYLGGTEGFDTLGLSTMTYFIRAIPYNLYAILAIVMVFVVILLRVDFGPMLAAEKRARKEGKLYNVDAYGDVSGDLESLSDEVEEIGSPAGARPLDMLLPLLTLVVAAIAAFPVSTWWANSTGDAPAYASFAAAVEGIPLRTAFVDSDASIALILSIIVTLAITYPYMIFRRLFDIRAAADAFVSGIKSMVPALIILALAWTIGAIIKGSPEDGGVGLPKFIEEIVRTHGITGEFMPFAFFIISAILAFSTGTSWGTMAIMLPISMPISIAIANTAGADAALLLAQTFSTSAAVMGGAVLGDHISPISDTTILSSIGAGCPLLEHVTTQIPYALFVATCTAMAYLVIGFTNLLWLGWLVALLLFVAGIAGIRFLTRSTATD